MAAPAPLVFGPFELDPVTLELRREGDLVPLEPLPARILLRLVEEEGAMVGRPELLELGWPRLPGAAEQALNTCVYQIRRALEAGPPHEVRLETLRGRGYRLVVPRSAPSGGDPARRFGGGHRRRVAAGVLAVALAGAAALLVRSGAPEPPAEALHALERARYLAERTGDPAAAQAVLDSARVLFPDVALVQQEWAEARFWAGEAADAALGASRAPELDPAAVGALRTLGMLALMEGERRRADHFLERALELDPEDTRTLTTLAFRRTVEGRFDEGAALLARAFTVDPLSTTLHRDAGLLHLLARRYPEAEHACREVLRFEPRSAWAADCLFDVMVLTGRTEEAARWGRLLVEVQGSVPPPTRMPADETVAAVEAWRLDAWAGAVEKGAYPLGLVFAYTANGRTEEALSWLRSAASDPRPGLLAVAVDPRLAPLHQSPAFREIVAGLRLTG